MTWRSRRRARRHSCSRGGITWPAPLRRAVGSSLSGDDVEDVRLESGMVFTVEPGVYLPGQGGVRLEDDLVVTADGYQLLTHVSLDLFVV